MENDILNIAWMWMVGSPYLSLTIGVAVAEFVTRLTPTKKDDGFVQRAGGLIKFVLDTVKAPNIKK